MAPGHRHLGQRAARRARAPRRPPPAESMARLGVGHGHDRGVAAERGRPGAGLDRLGLLAAGLAQVGVQVDQARADQAAARRRAPCAPRGRVDATRPTATIVAAGRRRRRRRARPPGPTTVPPRMTSGRAQATAGTSADAGRLAPEQEEQDGHADGHAVGHLLGDDACAAGRPRRRRSRRRAPSGPGCVTMASSASALGPARREPPAGRVLAQARDEATRSPARPGGAAARPRRRRPGRVVEVGRPPRPASPRARAAAGCPVRPG